MSSARHHKSRPITADRAVTWVPLDDGFYLLASVLSSMRAAPMAIMQDVLQRVDAHIRSAAPGVACGVLCGNQYFDPESQSEYLLVEQALPGMRVDHASEEDATVLAAVRRVAVNAEQSGQRVFGWYRGSATLRPHVLLPDAANYHAIFPHLWQAGLLFAGDAPEPRGALVRIDPSEGRAYSIPFVECALAPRKNQRAFATAVRWKNYYTESAVEPLPQTSDAVDHAHPVTARQQKKEGLLTGLFHRLRDEDRRSMVAIPRREPTASPSVTRAPAPATPTPSPVAPAPPAAAPLRTPAAPTPSPVASTPPPAAPAAPAAFVPNPLAPRPATPAPPPMVERRPIAEAPWQPPAEEPRVPDPETVLPVELERLFLPPPQSVVEELPARTPVPPPITPPPPIAATGHTASTTGQRADSELPPTINAAHRTSSPEPAVAPAMLHNAAMDDAPESEKPMDEPATSVPKAPEPLPDTREHAIAGHPGAPDEVLQRLRTLAHPERLDDYLSRRRRHGTRRLGAWPAIAAVAIIAIGFALWQRGALRGDRLVIRGGQLDPNTFHDESGGSGSAGARTGQAPTPTADQLGKAQFGLARMGAYGDDLAATLDMLDSLLATDTGATRRRTSCDRADSLVRQTTLQASLLSQARSQLSSVVGTSRQDWADALALRAKAAAIRVRGACP